MRLQLEKWSGFSAGITLVRHSRADRFTVRAGRYAVSLIVSHLMPDTIGPKLDVALACMCGVCVGVAVTTLKGLL